MGKQLLIVGIIALLHGAVSLDYEIRNSWMNNDANRRTAPFAGLEDSSLRSGRDLESKPGRVDNVVEMQKEDEELSSKDQETNPDTTTALKTNDSTAKMEKLPSHSYENSDKGKDVTKNGIVSGESKKFIAKDNRNLVNAANIKDGSNKCDNVRCLPAPSGVECKVKLMQVPNQLSGLTSICCPVHICYRMDGSTFFHYGIEVEAKGPGSGPVQQQFPYPSFLSGPPSFLPAQPVYSMNFARQQLSPPSEREGMGFVSMSLPDPAAIFTHFPNPFGLSLPPLQNNRFLPPSMASSSLSAVISDATMPLERNVRDVGVPSGPMGIGGDIQSFARPALHFPFSPDVFMRERRESEGEPFGPGFPFKPGGYIQDAPLGPFEHIF